MLGAFAFYLMRQHGVPTILSLVIALTGGAAMGAATHLLVMRPLRTAPALTRLVATLALLTICLAVGDQFWGANPLVVPPLLPSWSIHFGQSIHIDIDRLVILCVGVGVTILLFLVYKFTQFGLASKAVAENRRVVSAQGVAPDKVATINWMAGGFLAVLGAILVVNLTGLQVQDLTLLIVPALAASLVGGFASFVWTMAGGLLIGIIQSEIVYYQVIHGSSPTLQGASESVPFLIIIGVLVVRGRGLPLRGEAFERPPVLGDGRIKIGWLVFFCAAAALIAGFASVDWVNALSMTAGMAIVLLSIVVLTGYTGQLSLAQFSLAGLGAWIATELVVNAHLPFLLALVVAVLGTIPVGLLIGLPALRTRGVNLAIATFGFALLLESEILANQARTGGDLGLTVKHLSVFGMSIDQFTHPSRYAGFSIVCLLIGGLVVANVRRGRSGRRLIAVRTHERAAAVLGTSVYGAKLYAFGLAAGLAALGGVVIAFQQSTIVFYPNFAATQSIFVVVYAVLGGVGSPAGAVVGAALSPNSLGANVFSSFGNNVENLFLVFGGVLLLIVLIQNPNGLISIYIQQVNSLRRRLFGSASRAATVDLVESAPKQAAASERLEVQGLTVRFGGTLALDDVSLEVSSGQVVGLIGPNGAGKTTFIDAVTGLVKPAGGKVRLNDTDMTRWSARRRALAGLGRSFQSLELFDTLSVAENLQAACDGPQKAAYLTDLIHPGHSVLSAVAARAVREFRLEDVLDQRVDTLPFGQRRLVAIARAIASGASILLLDEPAAGLDVTERGELSDLVRRLASEWNLGVLIVEHDVSLVASTCDRVAVLNLGRKIAEGDPATILSDEKVLTSYLGDRRTSRAPATLRRSIEEPIDAEASAAPVVLQADDLTAGYDDLVAIRNVDLTVRSGSISVLLGPNGAGKSTTLLASGGELPLQGGSVELLGTPRTDPLHRRVRSGLGFVPEERAVAMSMSVGDNLRLGRGNVERALDLFPELRPLLKRRAGLCSGGEQQKLSIARALARNPKILLIDELSLGLAPMSVSRLLEAVKMAADAGLGVLLVEQHVDQALEIADQVYMLQQGVIVVDSPAEQARMELDSLEASYMRGAGAASSPGASSS
jgi:sulfate-transporting ATPase